MDSVNSKLHESLFRVSFACTFTLTDCAEQIKSEELRLLHFCGILNIPHIVVGIAYIFVILRFVAELPDLVTVESLIINTNHACCMRA